MIFIQSSLFRLKNKEESVTSCHHDSKCCPCCPHQFGFHKLCMCIMSEWPSVVLAKKNKQKKTDKQTIHLHILKFN